MIPGTASTESPARNQKPGLLAAPGQDERVTALEAHDVIETPPPVHQDLVDNVLGDRRTAGTLADVDQLGPRRSQVQDTPVDQPVVDDDIGPAQDLDRTNGEEVGCTGAGTDEVYGHSPAPGATVGPTPTNPKW